MPGRTRTSSSSFGSSTARVTEQYRTSVVVVAEVVVVLYSSKQSLSSSSTASGSGRGSSSSSTGSHSAAVKVVVAVEVSTAEYSVLVAPLVMSLRRLRQATILGGRFLANGVGIFNGHFSC